MDKHDRPLRLYQPFHLPGTPATPHPVSPHPIDLAVHVHVPITPLERHLELERQKQHHLAQYLIYRQLAESEEEARATDRGSVAPLRESESESGREDKTVAWVSSLDKLQREGLDFLSEKNTFPFTQTAANQASGTGEEFIQHTYTHFYDSSPLSTATGTIPNTTTTTSSSTTAGDSPSASTIRSSFSFPSTTLRTPPSTNPSPILIGQVDSFSNTINNSSTTSTLNSNSTLNSTPNSNVQGIKQGVKGDWTDITSYASLFGDNHNHGLSGGMGVKSFSHSHHGQGFAHGQALGWGQGLGYAGLDGAVRVGDEMSMGLGMGMGMGVGVGELDMDMHMEMGMGGMRRPINHAPFGFGFAPVYASPFPHPPGQAHAQAQAQAYTQIQTQPTHTFLPLYPPGVADSLYPVNGHDALTEFSVSPRPSVPIGKALGDRPVQPTFNGKVLPAYAGMGAFVRGSRGPAPVAPAGTEAGMEWGLENYHRGMARENADMFVQLMLNGTGPGTGTGAGENVSNVSNVSITTIVPPMKREDASTAPTTGTGKGETDELDSPSDDGMGEDERDVDDNVRAALNGHDHARSTDSRRPPSTSTGAVRNKPSSEHVHSRRTSGPYTRPEGGRSKSHSFGSESRSVSASASETPKRIVLDQEGNPSVVRNPLGGGRGYVPGETPDDPMKRHKCEVCGRGFARLYNLKSHAATHDPTRTKPFPCPHDACPRSFSRLHDLERHRQGIHGDGPLVDAKLQGIAPAVARAQERITAREVAYNGSTAKPAVPPLVAPSTGRAHTGDT